MPHFFLPFLITKKKLKGQILTWARFSFSKFPLQLITAGLIIYSTFAAIYYSKVNPIVSDYDYVDYLGGGRALGSTDADVIDDDDDGNDEGDAHETRKVVPTSSNWLEKSKYAMQFVLDAIENRPN